MFLKVVSWDMQGLSAEIEAKHSKWIQYVTMGVLFLFLGWISAQVTPAPSGISKSVAIMILVIGSFINFLGQIVVVFAIFKIVANCKNKLATPWHDTVR
jgi:uncharacterized membrane protein